MITDIKDLTVGKVYNIYASTSNVSQKIKIITNEYNKISYEKIYEASSMDDILLNKVDTDNNAKNSYAKEDSTTPIKKSNFFGFRGGNRRSTRRKNK